VAMINGYGQNGLRPATGVPGYPAQTGGVASAPPPPPPLPGETVEFSAPAAPAAPATPPGITTPSGVHSQHFSDQFGVGMKATLPAGVLLPAPVLIQLLQTPQGIQAEAHLENKDKTQVPVQMMNDGRLAVQLENSPSAPLLMFNPTNLDYGLSSQPKQEGGATKRALEETLHADGSRTLFQDTSFNPDGSVSYNHVHQAANGQTQASNVVQDRTGRVVQNNPLQANIDGNGIVSLRGEAGGGRSLKEHMKSSLSNWGSLRGPLLNWMSEKKEAHTQQIKADFVTFSSTMAKYPQRVFPTLAQASEPQAAPASVPTAPQSAPMPSAPPPPPLG
jgi:hypothetical protein